MLTGARTVQKYRRAEAPQAPQGGSSTSNSILDVVNEKLAAAGLRKRVPKGVAPPSFDLVADRSADGGASGAQTDGRPASGSVNAAQEAATSSAQDQESHADSANAASQLQASASAAPSRQLRFAQPHIGLRRAAEALLPPAVSSSSPAHLSHKLPQVRPCMNSSPTLTCAGLRGLSSMCAPHHCCNGAPCTPASRIARLQASRRQPAAACAGAPGGCRQRREAARQPRQASCTAPRAQAERGVARAGAQARVAPAAPVRHTPCLARGHHGAAGRPAPARGVAPAARALPGVEPHAFDMRLPCLI